MLDDSLRRLVCGLAILAAVVVVSPSALDLALDRSHPLDHERVANVSARMLAVRSAGPGPGPGPGHGPGPGTSRREPHLRLSFSLLVDAGSAPGVVDWGIEEALAEHFAPFLAVVSALATFEVDSQVLYGSQLVKPGSSATSASSSTSTVTVKELEGFLSANDWHATSVSQEHEREVTLHLMAYLPARGDFVIVDKDDSGAPVSVTSFLIPGWGGVHVLPASARRGQRVPPANLQRSMGVFKAFLCEMLGLEPRADEALAPADVATWQMHYLQRSVETLTALSNLTQSSSHMTVLARVADFVHGALDSVESVLDDLEKGRCADTHSSTCVWRAREAVVLSETAFFDPSLLPQLYFPPEHWFAVFMPFLLPALLPVATSLVPLMRNHLSNSISSSSNKS